jgi:prepilin-type N-terminal cleavage/methylation domain-containing protein/prepilin-type processing-associated H-X9-DG protein
MKRSGFTLIELLVVLAVLAVLTAILLPVLRAVKQQGRAVACQSNVKQLSMALLLYEHENSTFPHGFDASPLPEAVPPGEPAGTPQRDFQGWWWFNFLSDVSEVSTKPNGLLWCPARNVDDRFLLCGNYGANRAICMDSWASAGDEFQGKPLRLSQITSPSLTLLVVDSGYGLVSWRAAIAGSGRTYENVKREGAFYVPGLSVNESRDILPGFEDDAKKGRHPGKTVNIAFADFHVDRVEAEELLVEDAEGTYVNRSPLWLPD